MLVCGFQSHQWHRQLSVVNVYFQVQVSTIGRSLAQSSPTECGPLRITGLYMSLSVQNFVIKHKFVVRLLIVKSVIITFKNRRNLFSTEINNHCYPTDLQRCYTEATVWHVIYFRYISLLSTHIRLVYPSSLASFFRLHVLCF
jgi:hypothetical protein